MERVTHKFDAIAEKIVEDNLYEDFKSIIEKLDLSNKFVFKYRNKAYIIDPNSSLLESARNIPLSGRIFPSKDVSSSINYDLILISVNMRPIFKRPIILHEALTGFLRYGYLQEIVQDVLNEHPTEEYPIITSLAHEFAREFDHRYAKEILDPELLKEYERIKHIDTELDSKKVAKLIFQYVAILSLNPTPEEISEIIKNI